LPPINNRKPRRSDPGTQLIEYLEVPVRRPWHVVIPLVIVTAIAIALAYFLPKKYKSSTLILVESDKMPDSFVTQISTDRTTRHLQTLKQEVLSRTRLEQVITELNPYGTNDHEPLATTIERMRQAIEISVRGTDAFSIEYFHRDPQMAMRVADRLTSLFIEEAAGARQKQVAEAYQFIDAQLAEARRQLEVRDQALRQYKEQHLGRLPEQMTANLSTLQRLQLEQQTTASSLRSLQDRQSLLESSARPVTRADPEYSELIQLRKNLASLRMRYTDEHPDVRALENQIARIERSRRTEDTDTPAAPARPEPELEQVRAEIRDLRLKAADVDKRIADFQGRVEQAPRVEQDIATLTRDYNKLNENYLALLNKKLEAQMAAKLEQRWKGEQFRILDPANVPERPVFPDKRLFAVLGALLGLGIGMGLAVSAHLLDHSLKNVAQLEELLPFPVLANIPSIQATPNEPRRPRGGSPRRGRTSLDLNVDLSGLRSGDGSTRERTPSIRREGVTPYPPPRATKVGPR
jgi:polysaccharide chain length determinant protein (PEP-CTERM system associated)